jgi:pectin methylesterase-like acyl-CoA thioesterase
VVPGWSVSVCTSGCDYANLTSAFASLLQQGPNVTNVVNVAAGTYNENGRVSSYSVILKYVRRSDLALEW